jgi:hypothetical protein
LKLIYDQQSVGQSVMLPGAHLGAVTNFFTLLEIFFRQLGVCYFVAPSLTRGRVCNLLYNCFRFLPEQSLLGQSTAELTTIFYCLIWDSPTWRARSLYLYPPGTGWPSYTPRHWVPFMSPLTTRRDCGGGILTRLHTGLERINVS